METKYTIQEVLENPFTGIFYDCQTSSYMFFVMGTLAGAVDSSGKVEYPKEEWPEKRLDKIVVA